MDFNMINHYMNRSVRAGMNYTVGYNKIINDIQPTLLYNVYQATQVNQPEATDFDRNHNTYLKRMIANSSYYLPHKSKWKTIVYESWPKPNSDPHLKILSIIGWNGEQLFDSIEFELGKPQVLLSRSRTPMEYIENFRQFNLSPFLEQVSQRLRKTFRVPPRTDQSINVYDEDAPQMIVEAPRLNPVVAEAAVEYVPQVAEVVVENIPVVAEAVVEDFQVNNAPADVNADLANNIPPAHPPVPHVEPVEQEQQINHEELAQVSFYKVFELKIFHFFMIFSLMLFHNFCFFFSWNERQNIFWRSRLDNKTKARQNLPETLLVLFLTEPEVI